MVSEITKTAEVVTPITPQIETTPNIIDKAEAVAVRMEKANVEGQVIAARLEAAAARMMLSGRSEAGQVEVKKEETPKEYKDRIMRGG